MKTFDAQSVARDAALAEAEFATQVGDFVSVDYDDDNRVATYLFAADIAGYRGWRWCVTVAKVDDEATPTVCDVVVLPGPDSLLAPDHVPYMERILPEDIQPGVIVPSVLEDTRLVPGVNALVHDEGLDATEVFDLGLMRPRVLSIEGRDQASKRWYVLHVVSLFRLLVHFDQHLVSAPMQSHPMMHAWFQSTMGAARIAKRPCKRKTQ
ncbi:MAG: hypothetical protein RLZ23_689 [Actinomycetota bacterium]